MRLAPTDTWPDLRIVLRPLPWHWHSRPRVYADDPHPWSYATFEWLFLTVEWRAADEPRFWFAEDAARLASEAALERAHWWNRGAAHERRLLDREMRR